MMSIRFQKRDLILLEALALRVRLLGQRQAADAFWNGHMANARRRLQQLVREGMLNRSVVNAQPMPDLDQPLIRWRPGLSAPNPDEVSYRLKMRWRYRVLRPTVVYFPTAKIIEQFGGTSRPQIKIHQITHDLGVTAVWLKYAQQDIERTQAWLGEDVLAPSRIHQKLPDAALTLSLIHI